MVLHMTQMLLAVGWRDAEAPVTQSLPNLITGGFTQSDEKGTSGRGTDGQAVVVNSCG